MNLSFGVRYSSKYAYRKSGNNRNTLLGLSVLHQVIQISESIVRSKGVVGTYILDKSTLKLIGTILAAMSDTLYKRFDETPEQLH